MEKYSAREWQYWPYQREGQYTTRELNISPYCPTKGSATIDLLYDSVNKVAIMSTVLQLQYISVGLKVSLYKYNVK